MDNLNYDLELLKQEKSVVKAEAYKEFAERLKKLKEMPLITNNDIDNLLKELVGADNETR